MAGRAQEQAGGADGAGELVVVGRVGAAHGVRGWLRLISFTDPPDNLLGYRPWSLKIGSAWRPVRVEAAERRGAGHVCRFAGIEDRAAASTLRGALVAVPAAALPGLAEGEHYWRDLIGLEVVTGAGAGLGRVENLMETGANHALVTRDGQRERLIPFIAQVVREVDVARGAIVVDWEADF